MASRITYIDKEALQNDETVAIKNKVTSTDMNNIKQVVNEHAGEIEGLAQNKVSKDTNKDLMTLAEKQKLAGIEANANKYIHPSTHVATMITQDTTHRFVTDNEKQTWNAKASTDIATKQKNGLMSKEDKQKLDELNNYDDTELSKKISKLEQENVELKKFRKEIEENELNAETQSDTVLVVKNADNFVGKINVHGMQRQETSEKTSNSAVLEEGTHKVGDVTFTVTNGVLTANGTNNASTTVKTKIGTVYLEKNKTYYYVKSGTSGQMGQFIQLETTQQWFEVNNEKSFVATQTGKFDIFASAGAGQTTSGNIKLLISEASNGTWVKGEKETPSPQYLSEIECIKDSIKIITSNKNMAKINENFFEETKRGVKNKGTINEKELLAYHIKLKKGQVLKTRLVLYSRPSKSTTFSSYVNSRSNALQQIGYSSLEKTDLYNLYQFHDKTYTATEDCEIFWVCWGNSSNDIFEFKFTASYDEATSDKHEGEVLNMPLQQIMCEGDCFEEIDGEWYEKHNWGEYIFDGTENYVKAESHSDESWFCGYAQANLVNDIKIDGRMYCNRFKNGNYTQVLDKNCIRCSPQFHVRIKANMLEANTAEKYKKLLKEWHDEGKLLHVVYQYSTVKYIKCTAEQSKILDRIKTYRDYTIITTDNNLCKISLRYKQDLAKRIAELENQLATSVAEQE